MRRPNPRFLHAVKMETVASAGSPRCRRGERPGGARAVSARRQTSPRRPEASPRFDTLPHLCARPLEGDDRPAAEPNRYLISAFSGLAAPQRRLRRPAPMWTAPGILYPRWPPRLRWHKTQGPPAPWPLSVHSYPKVRQRAAKTLGCIRSFTVYIVRAGPSRMPADGLAREKYSDPFLPERDLGWRVVIEALPSGDQPDIAERGMAAGYLGPQNGSPAGMNSIGTSVTKVLSQRAQYSIPASSEGTWPSRISAFRLPSVTASRT